MMMSLTTTIRVLVLRWLWTTAIHKDSSPNVTFVSMKLVTKVWNSSYISLVPSPLWTGLGTRLWLHRLWVFSTLCTGHACMKVQLISYYPLTTRDKYVDDQWFSAVREPHEVYPQRYGLQDRRKETQWSFPDTMWPLIPSSHTTTQCWIW